jgi:hypothetical protein
MKNGSAAKFEAGILVYPPLLYAWWFAQKPFCIFAVITLFAVRTLFAIRTQFAVITLFAVRTLFAIRTQFAVSTLFAGQFCL